MKNLILPMMLITAAAGCMTATSENTNQPTGYLGQAGPASKLPQGASSNDAFAVFGPESGFERNPNNFDETCLSYAYGATETPSYVHAYFVNDVLSRATDGHAGLCTYADIASF